MIVTLVTRIPDEPYKSHEGAPDMTPQEYQQQLKAWAVYYGGEVVSLTNKPDEDQRFSLPDWDGMPNR